MRGLATFLAVLALAAGTAAPGYTLAAGAADPAGAGSSASIAPSPSTAPFPDVAPCHWAAKAVAEVAGEGIFVGFPPDPAYDSVNALRQVFGGLQCGRPTWSRRFVAGAPAAFPPAAGPGLAAFTLDATVVSLSEGAAVLSVNLTAVIDRNGARRTLDRRGTVTSTRTDSGWRVAYADLAGLDLPFFPR